MPIDPQGELEAQDVVKFVDHMSDVYSGAMTEWAKADDFYLQEYTLWPNDQADTDADTATHRPVYRSARAGAVVDQGTDAISTFAPIVTRPPTKKGKEAKDAANRVENAVADLMTDAFVREAEHAGKKSAHNGIMYNYEVLFTGLDTTGMEERPKRSKDEKKEDFEEREEEWEQERQDWKPLTVEAVRPGEVLMDPMEKHPDVAVRRYKLEAYKAAALSLKMVERQARRKGEHTAQEPKFKLAGSGIDDEYSILELYEPYTPTKHGVLRKDGGWVFDPEPNFWGFQPWCHAWGGGGHTPVRADGFETKYLARGFLHSVMDDIRMWDQAYAAVHTLLIRAAFARYGADMDPGEAVKMQAGTMLQGKKEDWWIEEQPNFPGQIFNHMEGILNDIRIGTFDPQIGGFRQSGVDTATQQILLSDASQRKFVVLNAQEGHLFSIVTSNWLRLAKHLMSTDVFDIDSLAIGAHKLTEKDIGNNFRIFVSFENIDPVVHAQQKAAARAEKAEGLQSWEGYQRIARVSDTTTLREEILDDRLDALMDQELLATRARQRGLDDLADKLDGDLKEMDQVLLTGADGETPLVTGKNGNGRA